MKFTRSFLEAITPTADSFLGNTAHYLKLCYVISLIFVVKITDNVLKIAVLYEIVVLLN
jgi:hypothetical protein